MEVRGIVLFTQSISTQSFPSSYFLLSPNLHLYANSGDYYSISQFTLYHNLLFRSYLFIWQIIKLKVYSWKKACQFITSESASICAFGRHTDQLFGQPFIVLSQQIFSIFPPGNAITQLAKQSSILQYFFQFLYNDCSTKGPNKSDKSPDQSNCSGLLYGSANLNNVSLFLYFGM